MLLSRFYVKGKSMEPSFCEGDFVIIRKFGKPRIGDVVVVDRNGKHMLKRVSGLGGDKYFLRGDNQIDGKVFTAKRNAIIGKVLFHIKKS